MKKVDFKNKKNTSPDGKSPAKLMRRKTKYYVEESGKPNLVEVRRKFNKKELSFNPKHNHSKELFKLGTVKIHTL